MSNLTLTKKYGDNQLLFASDIHDMWTELEAKINGNIDNDNVASGWTSLENVILTPDIDYSLGDDETGLVRYYSAERQFVFAHVDVDKVTYFKVGASEMARVDADANFVAKYDAYFAHASTVYPLSYLLGYQKPILVYSNGTTINMEQNTAVANRSLVVFPYGPIAVTENVAGSHKFRQLKTSATANGYSASHVGTADSGMASGVSLTANTWYFVYAVVVQGGDDIGNFIMVADTTLPLPTQWGTLDTKFGAGMWVYLGCFRYGFGSAQTTTMIPFQYDHQGWCHFLDRAATDHFFGIHLYTGAVSNSSSYTSLVSFAAGASGNAAPTNAAVLKVTYRITGADNDILGQCMFGDSTGNTLMDMPSFGNNQTGGTLHGWEAKIPNNKSIYLYGKRAAGDAGDDFTISVYISAFMDDWV